MNHPEFIITAAPHQMHSRYGSPIDDGDSESLGTYVFTSRAGAVVTVYLRANDVWSLLLKLARPMFWRSKSPVDLIIGATNTEDGRAFARWLAGELRVPYRRWS